MTNKSKVFRVDARVLLSLGRESIKDHATALVELVKNSYDADAQRVDVEISFGSDSEGDHIRISDNGSGMSDEDINEKWLRIGFSTKRKATISKKGRRETGEKGVGRLSADRLGAILELRTKKADKDPAGVRVDWDQFDMDDADISSVLIEDLPDPMPTTPAAHPKGMPKTGTEILIKALRQSWTADDVKRLEQELSTLVAPSSGTSDFEIWLKNGSGAKPEKLSSNIDNGAELTLNASFDEKGTMTYTITGRAAGPSAKRSVIEKDKKLSWKEGVGNEALVEYSLGKLRVSLSFYLRSATNVAEGLTLQQLRNYLSNNAGIRIYRDSIRVKPYGDLNHPEGDWLGMAARKNKNPAGAGRSSYRFGANQVAGAVFIGRDTNKELKDSAAREGLVQGIAFAALKSAVLRCILMMEGAYHASFRQKSPVTSASVESIPEVVTNLKSTLANLTKDLKSQDEPKKIIANAAQQLKFATESVRRAEQRFEEIASENVIYRGLATVGISSAVFGHETESALAQARMSTSYVMTELDLDEPDIKGCVEEIAKADEAVERIDLWGQFSLNRIKRDKRKRGEVNVSEVLRGLVNELKPLFQSNKITLTTRIAGGLVIRGFVMDVESVALNLLTNAYHHAGLQRKNREVRLSAMPSSKLEAGGVKFVVEDSGTGIAKENVPKIWDPLFSTKSDRYGHLIGTGLGLSIVQSVVREMGAEVSVTGKGALGGATFEVVMRANARGGK